MESTIFMSNCSQAVILPKEMSFPDDVRKVEVVAVGRPRIITPGGESWDAWFDAPAVSDDLMVEREQSVAPIREVF